MSSYLSAWLWAFAFTQLIEVPVYMRLLACRPVRAFGATALTHPLIWYAFPHLRLEYVWAVALVALFAWLGETLYFVRPYGLRRALWASLLANAASCALGFVSRGVLGVP